MTLSIMWSRQNHLIFVLLSCKCVSFLLSNKHKINYAPRYGLGWVWFAKLWFERLHFTHLKNFAVQIV